MSHLLCGQSYPFPQLVSSGHVYYPKWFTSRVIDLRPELAGRVEHLAS